MYLCSVHVMSWIIKQVSIFPWSVVMWEQNELVEEDYWALDEKPKSILAVLWLCPHALTNTHLCVCDVCVSFLFFSIYTLLHLVFLSWCREVFVFFCGEPAARQAYLNANGGVIFSPWAVTYLRHGRYTEGTSRASKDFQASTKVRSHQFIWLTITCTR